MLEFLNVAYTWVTTNWVELGVIALGIVTVAERIAVFTPTKKDDEFLAWVKSIFSFLAVKPVK